MEVIWLQQQKYFKQPEVLVVLNFEIVDQDARAISVVGSEVGKYYRWWVVWLVSIVRQQCMWIVVQGRPGNVW